MILVYLDKKKTTFAIWNHNSIWYNKLRYSSSFTTSSSWIVEQNVSSLLQVPPDQHHGPHPLALSC